MSWLRLAAVAAIVAVVLWAAKALAIALAGGLDESPLEGPLFVIGFLAILTAFATAGVAAVGDRSVGFKVVGAVLGLVGGFVLFLLVETGVGALVPSSAGWVKEEAGLWVASLLTAAVLMAWSARRGKRVSA
ncbi:hypothetical protein BH20ACT6_BH20ACT6_12050 [soil metagenome]